MNCRQFSERMQRLIDDRSRPETDQRLRRHSRHCADCRQQLETWQCIARTMPVESSVTEVPRRESWQVAACALACLILIAFVWRSAGGQPEMAATQITTGSESQAAAAPTKNDQESRTLLASTEIDPVGIWYRMQDQVWVERTMPAVRNVRESVAPLGRSLLQAVTMLTIGRGERTT